MNKKKCLLVCPAYTVSGYGVHSRQVANFLNNYDNLDVTLRATIWGNTPFILGDFEDSKMLNAMNARNSDQRNHYDIKVSVILPNEFVTDDADTNIGVSACVETDVCNPAWIDKINELNLMIVPSEHTKNVLLKTSYAHTKSFTTPIEVVPEAFPRYLENPDLDCKLNLEFDTKFNFLHVGQLGGVQDEKLDRKGIYTLIRLFCKAFKGDPDVGLVLKTNSCRNTTIDKHITLDCISQALSAFRAGEYPKVHVLHGPMSTEEMCQLYHHPQLHAFVSLTRGEGFGLPLLEAAAAGMPIIATNWSGHLDFLNCAEKTFIKVNYELKPIHERKCDNNIFMQGAKWAVVDEDDAIKKMKKLRQSYAAPKQWAKDMQAKIITDYNLAACERRFKEVFDRYVNK